MEEKKYPIYRFSASWNQIDFQNNFTSYYHMYKEEPTEEQLNEELNNWKNQLEKKHKEEGKHITEWHNMKYEYKEHESWCIGWSNHYTYNLFETDSEVWSSFFAFVNRKKQLNRKNGHGDSEQYDFNNKNPFYCLMGAEDIWRWNICRCEHCQKAGKITVNH
jgi:hypothetical protein